MFHTVEWLKNFLQRERVKRNIVDAYDNYFTVHKKSKILA